jgi:hypothetical protein
MNHLTVTARQLNALTIFYGFSSLRRHGLCVGPILAYNLPHSRSAPRRSIVGACSGPYCACPMRNLFPFPARSYP